MSDPCIAAQGRPQIADARAHRRTLGPLIRSIPVSTGSDRGDRAALRLQVGLLVRRDSARTLGNGLDGSNGPVW